MNPEFQVSGFTSQVSAPPLISIIIKEIQQSGAIPFRRFMEAALYHPEHGYYASGRARVGKEGDFFTSVSVGGIYGRLLASVCREVWERLGRPSPFTIVEQGANDGSMASDILGEIAKSSDDFSRSAHFLIVEPFAVNQRKQRERLQSFPDVSWVTTLEEVPEFTGIHLSNELLDAFPVDSLRWSGSVWEEECVVLQEQGLRLVTRPIPDPALRAVAAKLPTGLPPGFRVEWNPGLSPWLATLHAKLQRGIILTVDYGQAGEDRYAPHRADGTVMAYRDHQRYNDPLPEPGLRDITAQIDFTTLAAAARSIGFGLLGYSDQHHFLVGTAEPWLRSLGDLTTASDAARGDLRSLQTLLNPGTMGRQFKAIAFGKDFPAEPPLGCFKYQRPGVEALQV
jgi:SAM-dependent MidA family methyltransferase